MKKILTGLVILMAFIGGLNATEAEFNKTIGERNQGTLERIIKDNPAQVKIWLKQSASNSNLNINPFFNQSKGISADFINALDQMFEKAGYPLEWNIITYSQNGPRNLLDWAMVKQDKPLLELFVNHWQKFQKLFTKIPSAFFYGLQPKADMITTLNALFQQKKISFDWAQCKDDQQQNLVQYAVMKADQDFLMALTKVPGFETMLFAKYPHLLQGQDTIAVILSDQPTPLNSLNDKKEAFIRSFIQAFPNSVIQKLEKENRTDEVRKIRQYKTASTSSRVPPSLQTSPSQKEPIIKPMIPGPNLVPTTRSLDAPSNPGKTNPHPIEEDPRYQKGIQDFQRTRINLQNYLPTNIQNIPLSKPQEDSIQTYFWQSPLDRGKNMTLRNNANQVWLSVLLNQEVINKISDYYKTFFYQQTLPSSLSPAVKAAFILGQNQGKEAAAEILKTGGTFGLNLKRLANKEERQVLYSVIQQLNRDKNLAQVHNFWFKEKGAFNLDSSLDQTAYNAHLTACYLLNARNIKRLEKDNPSLSDEAFDQIGAQIGWQGTKVKQTLENLDHLAQ